MIPVGISFHTPRPSLLLGPRRSQQPIPHLRVLVCHSGPERTQWYGHYTDEMYEAQRQSIERAKWAESVRCCHALSASSYVSHWLLHASSKRCDGLLGTSLHGLCVEPWGRERP